MVVFLIEAAAILAFWKLADLTRARELFPVIITGGFIRFLEHYLIVDWFQFWEIHGPHWQQLWVPVSLDLTIWPMVFYLYIQYLPEKNRLLYGTLWVGLMLFHVESLKVLKVMSMQKGWHIGYSAMLVSFNFVFIYVIWNWIRGKPINAV